MILNLSRRVAAFALGLSLVFAPAAYADAGKTPARGRAVAPIPPAAPRIPLAASPVAPPRPWLYENSDVPMDAAWRFGTLPNGVRYAIRKNGVPPGQLSVRVRVDVGSLMERDDERGFAHFMEHLTFRGSKYVPDGESKRLWQRLGVSFGSDSNAQTTPTGTTYALDLPDATPASIDESLKILSGMMAEPNIVSSAVDAERAVVLAEMREGTSAQSKAGEAARAFLFAGQPLANRAPIGTAQSLNTATVASLQAFHDRWYRPEHVVIAIAGDVEPQAVEPLIVTHFGGWKARGPRPPAPDFGRPDPNRPTSDVSVQPGATSSINLVWLRPWQPKADTVAYNQAKLTDMVALQIINRRLEKAARDASARFLSAGVEQEDVSRSVDGTFVSIAPRDGDWEGALAQVRAIIEDARTTAPSEREIEREFILFDTALAIQVENQDTESGAKQAGDLVSAVDIRETTVSSQAALDIFRSARPGMTPQVMLASTVRLFSGDAVRASLTLPAEQAGTRERLTAALAAPVAPATGARLANEPVGIDALPAFGPAGKVTSRALVSALGIEMIGFSNGVKLMLFANGAETGKVRINVRFGRGLLGLRREGAQPAWAASYVLPANGIGALDRGQIDEIINGRRIGMDFGIDDNAFELAALTRPADYKDQLRLLAAKLAFPGWDSAPVERIKSGLLSAYDASLSAPQGVLNRDIAWLLRDRDARFRTPDKAEIMALDPQGFRAMWEPLLASGPVEVQVFGDVKADEAIAAVAETFGAMPARAPAPIARGAARLRFPRHNVTPLILRHRGDADQAAATVAWPTGSGIANVREQRQLEILSQIIGDRLFEKLRSVDGAAYSPNAYSNYPLAFEKSEGYLLVSAQLKPERVPYFYAMIRDVAADLVARPVSADELTRAVAPMRQLLSRASTGNLFWMTQMEGASVEPRYATIMKTIGRDMLGVSAQDLQKLARKYLRPDRSFSVMVLAEGAQTPQVAP